MSKLSPYLFVILAGLFYINSVLSASMQAVYIALGTLFLILGVVGLRRRSKKE